MPESPIKWTGSKRSILDQLELSLPNGYQDRPFVEPMVGGGSVFFRYGWRSTKKFLADANHALINLYKWLQEDMGAVFNYLRDYGTTEKDYYAARERYNQLLKAGKLTAETAALFVYLNKMGFNGLYRLNKDGEFNVPWGRNPNREIDYRKLQAAGGALRYGGGTELRTSDIRLLDQWCPEDAVVYADSPYVGGDEFTSYTEEGFGEADLRAVEKTLRKVVDKGADVIVSQPDNKLTREVFGGGWTVRPIVARRSVSRDGAQRGEIMELIFTSC